MSNKYIVAITEGVKTEKQILENIESLYFKKQGMNFKILPFKTNIYELWKTLKDDDFETNVVEVLKEKEQDAYEKLKDIEIEKIPEVYLFFDYDGHAASNSKIPESEVENVIQEMLEVFSNETEEGKIYISYPMVESIKDLRVEDSCNRRCKVMAKENINYKSLVHSVTDFQDLTSLKFEDWKKIISHNLKKANCILCGECKEDDNYVIPKYEIYESDFNQQKIFEKQKLLIVQKGIIFVLSSFPFFLVDYFGKDFYLEI